MLKRFICLSLALTFSLYSTPFSQVKINNASVLENWISKRHKIKGLSQKIEPVRISAGTTIVNEGFYQCVKPVIDGSIEIVSDNVTLDLNCCCLKGNLIINGTHITVVNGIVESVIINNCCDINFNNFQVRKAKDQINSVIKTFFQSMINALFEKRTNDFKSMINMLVTYEIGFPYFDTLLLLATAVENKEAVNYFLEKHINAHIHTISNPEALLLFCHLIHETPQLLIDKIT